MLDGGVGGSIAPQRQHRKAIAVRCAPDGVEERNTLRTVERNGTTSYKTEIST